MVVQLLIVFLILNISNSFCQRSFEAEQTFIELGVFQTVLYKYRTWYGSASCWTMVTGHHFSYRLFPLFPYEPCPGGITTCAWAGSVTACASITGQTKLIYVDENKNGEYMDYPPWHALHYPMAAKAKSTEWAQTEDGESACLCHCFHKNWGIYLGEMKSRESDNYVITGIRFRLSDNVLYLQPSEGKLEANEGISGFSWVPLPDDPAQIRSLELENVNFFFDDLILDDGYALTGIKFVYMVASSPKMVKGFGIYVSGRPYSIDGNLKMVEEQLQTIQSNSVIERYMAAEMPREVANRNAFLSKRSPVNFQYIELEESDKSYDYGQTTLPLFHNPRITNSSKLLSGFGMYLEVSTAEKLYINLLAGFNIHTKAPLTGLEFINLRVHSGK